MASVIRKLEMFVRVFCKKLPSFDRSKRNWFRRDFIKNKAHFLLNFNSKFEIAHRVAFIKFINLEFHLADTDIYPQ
jgi:hypothetical protein